MKTFFIISFCICLMLFLSSMITFAQKPELIVQKGHSGIVTSIAFSPNSKILASGSFDKTIKLWDVSTGKEIRTLMGHAGEVNSVTFSPKGKILASGSNDNTIKFWDVDTGEELRSLKGDSNYVNVTSIAFSPDGKILASGSGSQVIIGRGSKRKIKLWDANTGKELREFIAHFHYITSIAFSPDSKILAGAGWDSTITLWDVSSGKELRTLTGHDGFAQFIAFSPDGKIIASDNSGGSKKQFKLWDVATGKELYPAIKDSGYVSLHAFDPKGRVLVQRSKDKTLRLCDISTGEEVRVFEDYGWADNIVFSPNGNLLASSDYNKIRLTDVSTGEDLHVLAGHSSTIFSVAFSPDAKLLATGRGVGFGGNIKFWDLYNGKGLRTLTTRDANFQAVTFSPDNKLLASANGNIVTLLDVQTGIELYTLKGHYNWVPSSVTFSPNGKILASADHDTIKFWDVDTGKNLRTFQGGAPIAFSPDGKILAAMRDCKIILLSIDTGNEIHRFGHLLNSFALSPDGKILAGNLGKGIELWEVPIGKELKMRIWHSNSLTSLSISPDGKILASGSGDNTIKLWDVYTGTELHTLIGHSSTVNSVTFSPDGKLLASGAEDATTKIWDISDGKELATLIALDESDWVVITPDGRFDGSPEGLKKMHYVQNNQPIPLDAFFEQFYTPNLLAQVVSGELAPMKQTNVDFSKAIKLPPLVTITSPQAGDSFDTEAISITVEAIDQGGGIDEVRLYQNGKLVSEEQRGIKIVAKTGSILTRTYNMTLLPGINEFRATAFNADRTESNPAEIRVELKAAQASANLYLLAVGISEYKNSDYKLNYGKADAQAFADAVSQRGKGIFKQISQQMIIDADATRELIEAAFNNIVTAAKPQDAFVFFYAGHGVMSEGDATTPPEFYLVPSDVTQLYGDDALLAARAISAKRLKELCTRIPAQKQLVVIDACQAAGALESFALRGAAEEKAILQLARSAGVVILAATGTEQLAIEFGKLGHGVFTFALLQGLAGEADGGSPPDGKITVKELEAYLNDKVPELTKQYRGTAQYPHSYARGQDFPLGIKN